jgi:D-alanyl-D-alanine carboxypeptidase (penicillin-binding protein 5/6)
MNDKAKELGMSNANFVNATGWPDDNHLMSPRDLAILAQRIISDFPEYYKYYSEREYTYNNITQQNRNRLLGRDIGVDGLKTGHTEAAGYGITLSAKQGDRRLVLVINGLESDNARVEEGDKLLRWGFREFSNKTLVSGGNPVGTAKVWFGTSKEVGLVADRDLKVTLPNSAAGGISMTLKYTGPVPAPIAKGAHIADLVITIPDQEPTIIPLKAANDVAKLGGFARIWAVLDYYVFGRNKP